MILREHVEKLMREELERANEKFPLFASNHEGVAIIEEEIFEAMVDLERTRDALFELKSEVFRDKSHEDVMASARLIASTALFCAAEMIQVAAMGQKFRDSAEDRRQHEVEQPDQPETVDTKVEKKDDPYLTPEESEKFVIEAPSFLKDIIKGERKDRVLVDIPRAKLPEIFEALIEEDKDDE